ncbi:MAG: ABC transporter permease [Lactobacillus sp.]|jgi:putative ABC transport system permease protein|nr:ABC transporter permease [Lactobacillus sp.]
MQPLTKILWRNIRQSLGRFIAIILIILLGVLIYVGVKATGPALNDSAQQTVTDAKLSDIQVLSNIGFSDQDAKAAKIAGASVSLQRFKYVYGGKAQDVVALYGYQAQQQQDRLILTSGRLPKANGEIVLDQRAQALEHYKLGQTYQFEQSAGLKQRRYKIVGFANSPAYIDNETRGNSNLGAGSVRYFAYITPAAMNLPRATRMTIRFKNLQGLNTFGKAYHTAVNQRVTKIKRALTKSQLQNPGSDMALLKPTYTWQTRVDLPGFQAYGESSDRIAAIANVFPLFFFLIAALITFTTVTRMIEEARTEIGTLKALGFSKWAISRNYLAYALLAGTIGTVLGVVLGHQLLPRFVLSIYTNYIFHKAVIIWQWGPILLAVVFALVATLGAVIFVIIRELGEGPAALMRPKAPKSAKRIMLERFKPFWNRLSFNRKVSYRNLFRFKSRMVMTIVGIAGGTALLLTGFGIWNSITASGTRQYAEVIHYQALVSVGDAPTIKTATDLLQKNGQVKGSMPVAMNAVKAKAHGQQVNDIQFVVPKQTTDLTPYFSLRASTTGQALKLPQRGVIISQKLAKLLQVKAGQPIQVTLTNGRQAKVTVKSVTRNFMGHYIYGTPASFQAAFHQDAVNNTLLVRLTKQTQGQRDHLAKTLLQKGNVLGTSYVADQKKTVADMSAKMNPVILIFVLLSGVLSFVVLYNLTNINVSERIRELSTIKVLGFTNREVTLYIVRENIILTGVGIILGFGLGNLLTAFILHQAETENVVFPLTINWPWYFVAAALMFVFTGIVMLVTHRHLKRIDMIDALKSNE